MTSNLTHPTRLTKLIAIIGICLLLAWSPVPTHAKEFHGIDKALWSPDGRRIAFIYTDVGADANSQALYVMVVESNLPTKLAEDVESFAWSPDGEQIAVTHYNTSGISLIDSFGINGSQPTEIARGGRWPVWSVDGKQILYLGGEYNLYSMKIDGSDVTSLAELKNRPASIWDAKWSDDRQSVAFVGQPSEQNNLLGLYVADKNGLRELQKADFVGAFSWSPNGTQVIAETMCGKNPPGMCLYDTASGNSRFLGAGHSPLWSPDGKQIAFWVNSQVCTINVDGSDQQCLTEKQENNMVLLHQWSPDGRRLLFSRAFSPNSNGNEFRFEFDAFILDVQRASVKRWLEGSMIKH